MVQYQSELDQAFAALSDPNRRAILRRLGAGSASISELAKPFGMSLTGMKKHIGVLEEAGLVQTEKVGRVRQVSLGPQKLDLVSEWIEEYRRQLEGRLDRFAELVEDETPKSNEKQPRHRKAQTQGARR